MVYLRGREWFLLLVRGIALVLIPFPIFLFWQLFTWKEADPPSRQPAPPPRCSGSGRPVFILLFDEWSYSRSFQGGEFLPSLINLRRLAGQSFVFHEARSLSQSTSVSIPTLLFQQASAVDYSSGRPTFVYGGREVATTDVPSLFQTARDRGYSTTLIGWHLPYEALFGAQVDVYQNASGWSGDGLGVNMSHAACENLLFTHDPVARLLRRASIDRVQMARTKEILENSLHLIRDCPGNTFAFIHWNVPHAPYVFRADGTRNYFWRQDSISDYLGQICTSTGSSDFSPMNYGLRESLTTRSSSCCRTTVGDESTTGRSWRSRVRFFTSLCW